MSVEVDRIPAVALSLADVVFDDHAGHQQWVPIVGLMREGDYVLITCQGDEQALRIPAGSLVAARRHPSAGGHGEDADIQHGMSHWYPGDMDSASAAVQEHSRASKPAPVQTRPYPNSHYEGLYGGDLDHVVDAVGGTPDTETRGRRDEATRRRRSEVRPGADEADAPGVEDDEGEGELLGRMGDGYAGDVSHVFNRKRGS